MTERDALLVLNAVPGIGNIKIPKLTQYFGSAKNLINARQSDLLSTGILNKEIVENITNFPKEDFLKNEYDLMKKHNVNFYVKEDDCYPERLGQIDDAPVVIYVKGEIDFNQNPAVGIVGSRKASFYGLSIAEKLAIDFGELGIVVVSGMAKGIDTAAHKGCLKAKEKTIAVLGSGLCNVYPKENKALFNDISKFGAVISEFPMQTLPFTYNFPRRNRIISGLSLGIVVVEANDKSGALITADFALEQGRDVYAVPGKIDSPTSRGVNNLIKQGAKLITGIEDVIEDLSFYLKSNKNHDEKIETYEKDLSNDLTEQEILLYKYINNNINYDTIVALSGLKTNQVDTILLKLELKGHIKHLPGNRFIKLN